MKNKVTRKRLNKTQRKQIYNSLDGHCAYCGKEIEYTKMQVDHVKPLAIGGRNEDSNYLPSCRRCNHYKRTLGLKHFRELILTLNERIIKNYIVKVGIDYGIVKMNIWDGVFYFEKRKDINEK